jgi:hypothetical protein
MDDSDIRKGEIALVRNRNNVTLRQLSDCKAWSKSSGNDAAWFGARPANTGSRPQTGFTSQHPTHINRAGSSVQHIPRSVSHLTPQPVQRCDTESYSDDDMRALNDEKFDDPRTAIHDRRSACNDTSASFTESRAQASSRHRNISLGVANFSQPPRVRPPCICRKIFTQDHSFLGFVFCPDRANPV